MDRKGISLLLVALLGMLGLNYLASRIWFPPKLVPVTNSPVAAESGGLTKAGPMATSAPVSGVAAPIVGAPAGAEVLRRPEQVLALSNGAVRFVFSSYGGGLRQAELLDHKAYIHGRTSPAGLDTNAVLTLNQHGQEAVLSLVNGTSLEGNGDYDLQVLPGGGGVRAEKVMGNGLAIVREFHLSTNAYLLSLIHI
jgi:hypothetical protein